MRGLWLFWLENAKQSGWIADIGARCSDVPGYHSTGTDDGSLASPYRQNDGVRTDGHPEPLESMAVFEVEAGLIKTAWFYFPT
ncbi:hypothetical protein HNP16_002262 [Aeromonas hydrophila]|nr:hypothetical protein [Aeromonas hydrophila]